ncbi:hypothetical protein V1291_003971 [Nitrobacteraceae bacterium AZCC 1564]
MRVFMFSCLAIALIAVSATVILDSGFQESASEAFTAYGVRGPAFD